MLPPDNSHRLLCPVQALQYYLERTKNWWNSKKILIISYTNQSGDVTKNALPLWIGATIKLAPEIAGVAEPFCQTTWDLSYLGLPQFLWFLGYDHGIEHSSLDRKAQFLLSGLGGRSQRYVSYPDGHCSITCSVCVKSNKKGGTLVPSWYQLMFMSHGWFLTCLFPFQWEMFCFPSVGLEPFMCWSF